MHLLLSSFVDFFENKLIFVSFFGFFDFKLAKKSDSCVGFLLTLNAK
jgi:hypothetical protein